MQLAINLDGSDPHSFDTYRAIISDVFDCHRQEDDRRPYKAKVTAVQHADVFAHTGFHTAAKFERSVGRLRHDNRDSIALLRLKTGRVVSRASGSQFEVPEGAVLFMDRTKPLELDLSDCSFTVLDINRDLFERSGARTAGAHGRIEFSDGARYADALFEGLGRAAASPQDDDEEIGALIEVLAGLSGARPCASPHEAARTAEMLRHFIDANLDSDDLSVAAIARRMNMSRATLYRTFAGEGGVAAFVRNRRLDEAHRLLMTDSSTRVSDVALEVGYENFGHFSSAFRTRFGMSPRQARIAASVERAGVCRLSRWYELVDDRFILS